MVGVNESTCDRGHSCEVCSNFDNENSARAECNSSRGLVVRLTAGDWVEGCNVYGGGKERDPGVQRYVNENDTSLKGLH